VISSQNLKVSIVESNLSVASEPGQLSHCAREHVSLFVEHTFFHKGFFFCIEINCKMYSLQHECYVLMYHTDIVYGYLVLLQICSF
jgi:hypothetical protein